MVDGDEMAFRDLVDSLVDHVRCSNLVGYWEVFVALDTLLMRSYTVAFRFN